MFKLLKRFEKKDYIFLVLVVALVVLQVWLDLTMPDYTSKLTSLVASGSVEIVDVLKNGGMMLLCAVGSMISSFSCGLLCAVLAGKISMILKRDLYNKISSFSSIEMKKFSTPSLITRTTNDVEQIQTFVAIGLQILIKSPILAIWAISKISSTSMEWTVATLTTVIILVVVVLTIVLLALPKFKNMQTLIDNLNNVTRESLTGVRVVRAFNAENYQEVKFDKANEKLTKTQLFTSKATGLMSPVMTLCMNGLTLAIYWIGAILVNRADILGRAQIIGNMTAYTYYAIQVVLSFMMMIIIFIVLPRCIVSAKRINEVLDTNNQIVSGDKKNENKFKGSIEFNNVSFRYLDGQNNVLSNLTFKIKKGETVAIIGSTGCGKTTLINLISRFIDASEGTVVVDGMDVKDYNISDLTEKIAVVSQKACMFKGDIKSNIAYGKSLGVDNKKLNLALEVAQAGFVQDLDKGVDSEVAQGGTNFSGGQKQRLSIARAVYKDAEIIIFDDSFSALDYKTDMLVRKNLKQKLKDKTIIIVAQRIGTIKDADSILVLDNGKLVGMGKHEELLKTCSVYKDIALSQLNEEELCE